MNNYPCSKSIEKHYNVLMPFGSKLEESIYFCKFLGGKMTLLKSSEDTHTFLKYVNNVIEQSKCNSYLWLPYVQSKMNPKQWFEKENIDNKMPEWMSWEVGQPNGQGHQPCSGLNPVTAEVLDLSCNMEKNCFACNFIDINMFSLRGLCENLRHLVDDRYLVDTAALWSKPENGIIWTGFQKSQITLEKTKKAWMITSSKDLNITLMLKYQVEIYYKIRSPCSCMLLFQAKVPIGNQVWKISGGSCANGMTELNLLLHSCNTSEFGCDDGMCVDMDKRCNGDNDCLDSSDEKNCDILFWPAEQKDSYLQGVPPHGIYTKLQGK